jgi:hypothetical protein
MFSFVYALDHRAGRKPLCSTCHRAWLLSLIDLPPAESRAQARTTGRI